MCVSCNRSQKTSQRVKNNSHTTRLRVVLCCSLHAVTSSVIYYSTHTRKNVIYLLTNTKRAHERTLLLRKYRNEEVQNISTLLNTGSDDDKTATHLFHNLYQYIRYTCAIVRINAILACSTVLTWCGPAFVYI